MLPVVAIGYHCRVQPQLREPRPQHQQYRSRRGTDHRLLSGLYARQPRGGHGIALGAYAPPVPHHTERHTHGARCADVSRLFALIDMQGVVGEVTVAMNNLIKASLVILVIAIGVAIPNIFVRSMLESRRKLRYYNLLVERHNRRQAATAE